MLTLTHSTRPKVGLFFEAQNAYARGLLVGIGEYILSHDSWRVQLVELRNADNDARLGSWDGQGLIVRTDNAHLAARFASLPVPMVDLTSSRLLPHAPWVKADDVEVSQLAVRHFLERGFRNFGFCGDPASPCSNARLQAFVAALGEAGFQCNIHDPKHPLENWLQHLPKPVAVFASYDGMGQQVLEACRRAEVHVPEEVAVLGVDNDDVLCALSATPLSSVILNAQRAGWEAAFVLDCLMRGEEPCPWERFVQPLGVQTRQSTDVLAVDDPQIVAALRFIREHAREGVCVTDVTRHSGLSRRTLEVRFKALLGRTPRQEIARVQLNHVKELLAGTNLTLAEISARSGFEHAEYLSVAFKRETGLTASDYRNQHRVGR